jgi:Trypsin-like peptidase domain
MKCIKQWSVIICFLLINSLFFPLSGNAKSRHDFPSNNNLKQRNVALEMYGFSFTSGINRDGSLNGQGLNIVESGCAGSGFLVGTDGTIVTNYHVASKALGGFARFDDGGRYPIRSIKVFDPYWDLAILKITANKQFASVVLGDSNTIEPLDDILAVGNPKDMGINLTLGNVSQVVRDDNQRVSVIRHTATITSGNSGGALYKQNKVVGVNSSVVLGPGSGQSGFYNAMPINEVRDLLRDPKFQQSLRLESVFSRDKDTIIRRRCRFIDSMTANVPAGSSSNNPGIYPFYFTLGQLQDYLILVDSPGRDLDLVVQTRRTGGTIGVGAVRDNDYDGVFISNMYPKEVLISVLNYDSSAANFAIKIYRIIWGPITSN